MKTKILLLFLLGWVGMAFGQEGLKEKDTITFINSVNLSKNAVLVPYTYSNNEDIAEKLKSISTNVLKSGIRYIILSIDEKSKNVIVSPINFKVFNKRRIIRRNNRKNFLDSHIIDKSINSILYNDKSFEISLDNLKKNATKKKENIPDRFSIGILTLPFKYRPQDEKTFEAQFNLNSSLNVLLVHNFWGSGTNFYAQIGAGLGSVELNSNNSYGVGLDENINAATLTAFGGVMLQYKKVQAGFYFGCDQINNQNHYQWRNNGNLWLGFGIGYQLFNVGLGESKSNNNDKK